MEAIVTVGIPRSGKSKYAQSISKTHKEINRDNTRLLISGCKTKMEYWRRHSGQALSRMEEEVTKYNKDLIRWYYETGCDIIVSDTNLNKTHRTNLIEYLETIGYDVVIKDFPISFETAMRRNERSGEDYVQRSVMVSMWKKWLEYTGFEKAEPFNPKLGDVYLCDIDGTIAQMHDRGPFDWKKVGNDLPRQDVIRVVEAMALPESPVIFFSGRDSVCFEETYDWISKHVKLPHPIYLFMRPEGSTEKDYKIKLDLFNEVIRGKYNVIGVFDDRPQVVRLWRDLGLTVFNVGEIDHEF